MAYRLSTPRVFPVSPEERIGPVRELLDSALIPGSGPINIQTTLIRAPGLFRRWFPFAGKLLNGKIPPRDRELLTLRTGWNCQAEYEWAQAARRSFDNNTLSAEEITRVTLGPDAEGWEPFESTLLRTADELHTDSIISDVTWKLLAAHYEVDQLIEIPMLVGQYHLISMTLNSLGVQLDEGLPGFPTRQ